jgi:hypothetical protein
MVSQVKEKNAIVCTVNVEEQAKSEPIEDSNSDVLVAMKMIVDSIHLEPELMCSLCHEIFFKVQIWISLTP